ncbi:MAG TPA: bacteriohemerythrin [Salinivirga sp.]|uniref:bacteriohemerythrin n=1 Tax=Salinivirga sp. TaxID=1970192 RepID=UPI002B47532E|nr:bacteriohemerythrin [Salinivirga sp.]HKK58147.1 bacteriohemerythrin [Salinivirga sp.]
MKSIFTLRMNLKNRMLFLILSFTIVIFIVAVGYIGLSSRSMAYKSAKKNADKITAQSALEIENKLNVSMDVIRTLAQSFSKWEMWPDTVWQHYVQEMYYPVYKENPQIYKLWDSWEMNMVDDDYNLPYGRYTNTYYRLNGKIKFTAQKRSINQDPPLYAKIKEEARESIWEPYWDVFSEEGETRQFMTSMSVPIKKDGKYAGIIAVDITMDALQEIVSNIRPMERSYAFLISNEGTLISHPDTAAIGKSITEVMPDHDLKYDLAEKIKAGKKIAYRETDNHLETETYRSYAPVIVGKTNTPWSIGLSIPVDIITAEADNNLLISILVTLIGLVLLTIIIYFIAIRISSPISRATKMLKKIEDGDIHNIDKIQIDRHDEIGDMANSLNMVTEGLNETARFAEEIGKGNLTSDYKPKSEKDVLGNALIEMRQSLQSAREEEEKRKAEDEKQRWITNGLAKFGEILRQDNDNLEQLSFNIISNLVDYLDANQGAIFVLNDHDENDQYFELLSSIAYDRRRYMQKKVKTGEDLVGRCAHEKATIYMTDVPDDYVEITSGMGTANPNSILIVPVMMNDIVYGVVEMASFNEMTQYQIDFVEKIGESIASTLNSVKVNQRTQKLLKESQRQREELSAQEEEMRQNLEELQTTQEEAARREFETRGLINALSASTYTVEYDLHGTITDTNDRFAALIGMTKEQMIGLNHSDGVDLTGKSKEDYERFWEDLRHGIPRSDINHINYGGKDIYLRETYTPILDEDDKPYKVLKIGIDITEQYQNEKALEKAQQELQKLSESHEQNTKLIEELKQQVNTEKAENIKLKNQLEEVQNANPEKSASKKTTTENKELPEPGKPLINKNKSLRTGIEELDEQHDRIIDMVNDIFEAFRSKTNRSQIKESLKTLIDYSSWHFSNEERYFEQFGFEEADAHKKSHNGFTSELQKFSKTYDKGRIEKYEEFMLYVKHWIESHFANDDQKYVDLFKSKGL